MQWNTGVTVSWFPSHLNVLHVLKEVRLGVIVVGELHQVSELFLRGERLHQARQHVGVFMLHTLVGGRERLEMQQVK